MEKLRRLTREGRREVVGRECGGDGGRGLRREEGGRSEGWDGKGIGGLPRGVGGTGRMVVVAAEEGGREGRVGLAGLVGREKKAVGVLRPETLGRWMLREEREVCCRAGSSRERQHREGGERCSWQVGGGKME